MDQGLSCDVGVYSTIRILRISPLVDITYWTTAYLQVRPANADSEVQRKSRVAQHTTPYTQTATTSLIWRFNWH